MAAGAAWKVLLNGIHGCWGWEDLSNGVHGLVFFWKIVDIFLLKTFWKDALKECDSIFDCRGYSTSPRPGYVGWDWKEQIGWGYRTSRG